MLNPRLVRLSDRGIDRSLRERPIRPPPALVPDRLAVALGAVIFRIRRRAGLSQRQLAARLGIHPSAVSRWESGSRVPTVPHLALLGDVANCPVSALLVETEELLRLALADGGLRDGFGPDGQTPDSQTPDGHAGEVDDAADD